MVPDFDVSRGGLSKKSSIKSPGRGQVGELEILIHPDEEDMAIIGESDFELQLQRADRERAKQLLTWREGQSPYASRLPTLETVVEEVEPFGPFPEEDVVEEIYLASDSSNDSEHELDIDESRFLQAEDTENPNPPLEDEIEASVDRDLFRQLEGDFSGADSSEGEPNDTDATEAGTDDTNKPQGDSDDNASGGRTPDVSNDSPDEANTPEGEVDTPRAVINTAVAQEPGFQSDGAAFRAEELEQWRDREEREDVELRAVVERREVLPGHRVAEIPRFPSPWVYLPAPDILPSSDPSRSVNDALGYHPLVDRPFKGTFSQHAIHRHQWECLPTTNAFMLKTPKGVPLRRVHYNHYKTHKGMGATQFWLGSLCKKCG